MKQARNGRRCQKLCRGMSLWPGFLVGMCLVGERWGMSQEPSPRHTRTVEVIQRIEAGVAAIFAIEPNGKLGSGSGSVISDDGYILTNDHVVRDLKGFALLNGLPPLQYQTIGRIPDKDLAIIRIHANRQLTAVPLGRSHDLMNGEPILVGGNPGGRGIVFSSGIISSRAVMANSPNALVMASRLTEDTRDRMIQIDAASNPGNSGGPLVNAEGLQIGVVAGKNLNEENINYAIPIDRLRSSFHSLVAPEERGDFWTGLELDPLLEKAVVTRVVPDSPADKAGLRVADVVESLNGRPIRDGLAWLLALSGRKTGDSLQLAFARGGKPQTATVNLQPFPLLPVVEADAKSDGLSYSTFHGRFTALPDFLRLKPVHTGTTSAIQADRLEGTRDDEYALVFTGYFEISRTGVYRLVIGSDDGSRLLLHGQVAIDSDGLHPYQESSCIRRLAKGLHPIRVEYFEGSGEARLSFRIEADLPSVDQPPVTVRYFHDKK